MTATSGGRTVIVGGGVVGLAVAHALGARGYRDVTVVERHRVGGGTTARGTGGIRTQFSSRVNVELVQRAMPLWDSLADRTGRPFTFRRHGYLFLLTDEAAFRAFRANVATQRALGVAAEVLGPDRVTDVFPGVRTDDLAGATYTRDDGSAAPAQAVAAYLHGALACGVTVLENLAFLGLQTRPDGTIRAVRTSGGLVEADRVVLAAGPQSRAVGALCGVDVPVYPHPRQAFRTRPLVGLDPALPLTVDMASGAYVHPEAAGGTAIIGGSDRDVRSTERAGVDWARVPDLVAAVAHRFPALGRPEITDGWSGLREMTPDDHAIVGPVDGRPGLWIAAGFSGHGFMQSPAVGEALAAWLLDGSPGIDLAPLSPSRFDARTAPVGETAVF